MANNIFDEMIEKAQDIRDYVMSDVEGDKGWKDQAIMQIYDKYNESGNMPSKDDVRRLQQLLNKSNVTDAQGDVLEEDGILGPSTNSALQNFLNPEGEVLSSKIIDIVQPEPPGLPPAIVPSNPPLRGKSLSWLYNKGLEKGPIEWGKNYSDSIWQDILNSSFLYQKGREDSAKKQEDKKAK